MPFLFFMPMIMMRGFLDLVEESACAMVRAGLPPEE